jgi:hypothetical protein
MTLSSTNYLRSNYLQLQLQVTLTNKYNLSPVSRNELHSLNLFLVFIRKSTWRADMLHAARC